MIPKSIEEEAVRYVKDVVPSYLFGEAINAVQELPAFTELELRLRVGGERYRAEGSAMWDIVKGLTEVSFNLHTETPHSATNVSGSVIHNGDVYDLAVFSYEPLIISIDPYRFR